MTRCWAWGSRCPWRRTPTPMEVVCEELTKLVADGLSVEVLRKAGA